MSRPLLRVLILVAAIAIVIPAASSANTTSPPTWPNHYDWPASGQGYVGWHSSTTAPDDYGMRSALGDQHGLWLWPLGGHKTYNSTDYAQWTYTAPGTTALKTVTLSYAWTNKLLAHHCIDVGFLDASGKIVTKREACKPPPQSPLRITLNDPSDKPTSKVLYFRIRVDCGGARSCSKTIPTKDPLKNGAYARLLKADMTLVDDDNPTLTPSGPFFDLAGTAIYGDRSYDLTASADDAGAGVTRVWLEQNGSEIASVDATCDRAHNTPPLDNRVCPKQKTLSTSIDTSKLAEGNYIYVVKAEDVAGNVGQSGGWLVVVDRTPPDAVPSGSFHDLGGTAIFGDRSYDLTVNADDSLSGVARVWVEQNGAESASASAVCNPDHNPLPPDNRICPLHKTLSATIDTSKLAEGAYIYVVKAEDAAGNIGKSGAWLVVVDRTPPGVTPSGSFYGLRGTTTNTRQSYDLTVNADDSLSGVARVWVEQNGAEIASASAVCNPDHDPLPPDNRICPMQKTLSTSIDTSTLADGSYTYVVKARDAAGNVGSQSWTIVIDRTPPSLSLSGSFYDLKSTTVVGEDTYDLSVVAADPGSGVSRVWLEQDGAAIASEGGSCNPAHNSPASDNPCPEQRTLSASIDTSDLDDGTYTFVAKTEDPVGNVTQSASWTVTIVSTYGEGSDDAPGGGADGYDPTLDPDPACDAYVDFGIDDWCSDSDSSLSKSADDLSISGTSANDLLETSSESSTYSGGGPKAVFWSNRGSVVLVKEFEAYITAHDLSGVGDFYFANEAGRNHKVPAVDLPKDENGNYTYNQYPDGQQALEKSACLMNPYDSNGRGYDRATGDMPSNFHAAPVFNWTAWGGTDPKNPGWRMRMIRTFRLPGETEAQTVARLKNERKVDLTWYGMGVLFRQAMKSRGCKPGDMWFVNELHSDWRSDKTVRARVADLLRGLRDGDKRPGNPDPNIRGFAADVVSSHDKSSVSVYKSNLKNAYVDTKKMKFWEAMYNYLEGYAKETYVRCAQVCTGGSKDKVADNGIINYTHHMRYLSMNAPANSENYDDVKRALNHRYMPLLNAVWNSTLPVYDSRNTVTRMSKLIRLQIYAIRRAADDNIGSAGRIGFAWKEPGDEDAWNDDPKNVGYGTGKTYEKEEGYAKTLAENLISSLMSAYQDGPHAACYGVGCQPTQSHAEFNEVWNTFQRW